MSRTSREFTWTNEDSYEGVIVVSYGPWSSGIDTDAPIMVSFEDATWMGVETAAEFQRWFKSALAEAKRLHQPLRERSQ